MITAATTCLKVKMLSSEYPPCWGGVGKHVQNLCQRLQASVDLHLITATYGRPVEKFQMTNLAQIRVRSFPILLGQYLLGVSFSQRDHARITHVHVPHALLPRNARKIVSTFHVVWDEYSEAMRRERPISLFDLQFPNWNRKLVEIEKKLALLSDAIIAVSDSVKNELVVRYRVPSERIKVVHNGVDTRLFRPSSPRRKIILFVGRQTAHKGLPILLQAFATFAKDHPDYSLVLVGERLEGGIDPSLVRFSRSLGIEDKVAFTGRLPENEVREAMGRSMCLVLPSLVESFGMVVLEAMASETPVVATHVGGIPEVVRHGFNGLLVPPGDSISMADAIERIVCDPKFGRSLARQGRKTAREFSWDKVATRTLEVYHEVAS